MMMLRFGWRTPFFIFGLIGLGWAALWYWYYRDTPSQHSRINAAERQLIEDAWACAIPACEQFRGAEFSAALRCGRCP